MYHYNTLSSSCQKNIMLLKQHFYTWVTVLAIVATMTSCERVTKPTSDSTPPKLRWKIENQTTGATIDITGSASYAPKPGNTFRVTLIADDPEGIHKITLKGHFLYECRIPDGPAQNISQSTFPLEQILNPNPQGQVLTTIILIDTFALVFQCDPDFQLRKITGQISGRGENYFAGVTEEVIDIFAVP
jgi:hypothetical protein